MVSRSLRLITSVSLLTTLGLAGCKPTSPRSPSEGKAESKKQDAAPTPVPTPTPKPTPTPTPRPLYIPRKDTLETAQLYNGAKISTTLETAPGTTATKDRALPGSYEVQISVKLTIPKAHQSVDELSSLNPHLPKLLPGLAPLLETGKIAPSYEELYRLKLSRMERNLPRLDRLMTRHDLFDCETILHLQDTTTKRKVILLQGDMDVDTDGSDGDRLPNPEGKDMYFQPMTSYKWPKRTEYPNPFLPRSEEKLQKVRQELADARKKKGVTKAEIDAIQNRVGSALYEVNQLKKNSFLLSATDPYIVLPGFMLREKHAGFTPKIGDYAVVIYDDVIYPAILGDAGPSHKVGEASLRLTKQLNARSTAYSRPVSTLKVTYLVFPGSAEKEPEFPDLEKWQAKVSELLGEIGGHAEGKIYAWETTWQPHPTPTPTPTPTPEPTPDPLAPEASPQPGASPLPSPSPSPAVPGGTPLETPPAKPLPTPTPGVPPAPTPTPSPAPSPASAGA